jgi:hypothetical protein
MQLYTVFNPPQVESKISATRLERIITWEKAPGISLKCGCLATNRCGDLFIRPELVINICP